MDGEAGFFSIFENLEYYAGQIECKFVPDIFKNNLFGQMK